MQLLCLQTENNKENLMVLLLRYIEDKYIPQKFKHHLLIFLQEHLCLVLLYWTLIF